MFGSSYSPSTTVKNYLKKYRLIYVGDDNENFDDFESFGVWTSPNEKLKKTSTVLCSRTVQQTILDCV